MALTTDFLICVEYDRNNRRKLNVIRYALENIAGCVFEGEVWGKQLKAYDTAPGIYSIDVVDGYQFRIETYSGDLNIYVKNNPSNFLNCLKSAFLNKERGVHDDEETIYIAAKSYAVKRNGVDVIYPPSQGLSDWNDWSVIKQLGFILAITVGMVILALLFVIAMNG